MTFAEEKKKARLEHRLAIWRMIWDKLALGAVLAVVALVGQMLLVDYESALTKERFVLQTRLESLQALRKAYSRVVDTHTYYAARAGSDMSDEQKKKYTEALQSFMNVANQRLILFSTDFDMRVNHHVWIHEAIIQGGVGFDMSKWAFAVDVINNFDELTRIALSEEKLDVKTDGGDGIFQFVPWTSSEVVQKGSKAFFEANYKKWEKYKSP